MKLNSTQELVELLETLGSMGYSVPFANYANELVKRGFTKHISAYNTKVVYDEETNEFLRVLIIDNTKDNVYTIELKKRGM